MDSFFAPLINILRWLLSSHSTGFSSVVLCERFPEQLDGENGGIKRAGKVGGQHNGGYLVSRAHLELITCNCGLSHHKHAIFLYSFFGFICKNISNLGQFT